MSELRIEPLEPRWVMATLTVDGANNAVFSATAAEANNVGLAWNGTTLTITDAANITVTGAGAGIFAGSGSTSVSTTATLASLQFLLGDANDAFTANSIPTNVTTPISVDGGEGSDTFTVNLGTAAGTGAISFSDSGVGDSDHLIVNGDNTAVDTLAVANRTVTRGSEVVSFNSYQLETLTVDGQGMDDVLNISGQSDSAYTNFAPGTGGITTSNNAAIPGTSGDNLYQLQLTPATNGNIGSAYRTTQLPVTATTSFQTRFGYDVTGTGTTASGGTSGFTFTVRPGTSAAIGTSAGWGANGIANSVSVVFDTTAAVGSQRIFIVLNGDTSTILSQVAAPFNLRGTGNIWIEYDDASGLLNVYISQTNVRPDAPIISHAIDLFAALGSPAGNVAFGFTASAGTSNPARIRLDNWDLSVDSGAGTAGTIVRRLLGGAGNDTFNATTATYLNFTIDGGAGTDTGNLTLTGGTLTLANDQLVLGGNLTIANANVSTQILATGGGSLGLGAATRTFAIANGSSRFDLIIRAPISETAAGQSLVVTSNGNAGSYLAGGLGSTYTGTMTITNSGADSTQLWIDSSVADGAPSVIGNSTSALTYAGTQAVAMYFLAPITFDRDITIGGGGTKTIGTRSTDVAHIATINSTVTVNSTLSFDVANPLVMSATSLIAGASGLSKGGGSTVSLFAANTYAGGTNITSGQLVVRADGALGATSSGTTISGTGTLAFETVIYTLVENVSGTSTSGSGVIRGNAGVASFAGNITLTGSTSINFATGADMTFTGATLNLGSFVLTLNTAGVGTFNNAISGAGSIIKTNTGTITLAGNNTYGGGTTISGGTLVIANTTGSGTGTGAVSVATGTTLAGTGTIGGAVTVAAGGIVAPGLIGGTGTLTVDTITFDSGSTLVLVIAGSGAGQFDQLVANTAITVTAGAIMNLTQTAVTSSATSYILVQNNSAAVLGTFTVVVEGYDFPVGGRPYTATYLFDATSGTVGSGNDLALVSHALVSGFVWSDTDGDGIQDVGETGLAGITVQLLASDLITVLASMVTGADGLYQFFADPGSIAGSNIAIAFVLPSAAFIFTPANQGGDDTLDSDAELVVNATTRRTLPFLATYTLVDDTHDAGAFTLGSVQGVKYDDTENNGVGGVDTPRAGDTIELYFDANNNNVFDDALTLSTTTAAGTGFYSFDGLAPGRYFVQQVVPAGREQTAPLAPLYYTVVLTSGQVSTGNDFYDFNPAPTADAGGPYTISEGDSLTVDGSASSDVGTGTIVSYAWDIDGDGQYDDAGGAMPTLTWAQLIALDIPVNDNGTYTLGLEVTDNEGKTATTTVMLTVLNTAPSIDSVNVTPTIDENGLATLSGTISDPSPADSFTIQINWGDGSIESYSLPAGATSFSFQHQYLDDNPTGTPSDSYPISITLTDKDLDFDTAGTSVTVVNVAPVAGIQFGGMIVPGQPTQFTGTFTDVGSQDTHEVAWDFGDGTTIGFVSATSPTASPTHVYANPGVYTVTITVRDDDGGVTSHAVQVVVGLNGLGADPWVPGGTAFFIGGTAGADKVSIKYVNPTTVQILVNGQSLGRYSDLSHIFVFGQGGNDTIRAFANVRVPLVIDGGAGKDILEGGQGSDVIIGGAGRDRIFGGIAGRDILIGGYGKDWIKGTSAHGAARKSDNDIIIGGYVTFETQLDQLFEVWSKWNGDGTFQERVASVRMGTAALNSSTVLDDGKVDNLFGGPGPDWFWYTKKKDIVTVVRKTDVVN